MNSIRSRLTIVLLGGLSALLTIFGVSGFLYVRHVLLADFDAALHDKARLFAAGTEDLNGRGFEFEMIEAKVPEYLARPGAEYVQLWESADKVLLRTPSLEDRDLCSMPKPDDLARFSDIRLPDGRAGRLVCFAFVPHLDIDAGEPSAGYVAPRLLLAFAATREGIDNTLQRIRLGVVSGVLLLLASIVATVSAAVNMGLRPLNNIAQQANEMGENNLSDRFGIAELPRELTPIAERLNDLLDRIEVAFTRERRFTADAAHELRTPIAELRTLAEVGLIEADHGHPELKPYLRDVLDIAMHLQRLITSLLALARAGSGTEIADLREMDLAALIRQTWPSHDAASHRPDLQINLSLPGEAQVISDSALAATVLANLFSNVISHAAAGGDATVELRRESNSWNLRISNHAPGLDKSDLNHLFEAFWRKSADRGGQIHTGLGLALAAECARLSRANLVANLDDDGTFSIEVAWTAA